jgi:hypothetical protein
MRPTRWMRAFLVAAGVFALGAGTLLALGADRTDTRFAWTITSNLTTAFLNGMYWGATILLLLSARERLWWRYGRVFPGSSGSTSARSRLRVS